jgi:hypothetical protein
MLLQHTSEHEREFQIHLNEGGQRLSHVRTPGSVRQDRDAKVLDLIYEREVNSRILARLAPQIDIRALSDDFNRPH